MYYMCRHTGVSTCVADACVIHMLLYTCNTHITPHMYYWWVIIGHVVILLLFQMGHLTHPAIDMEGQC